MVESSVLLTLYTVANDPYPIFPRNSKFADMYSLYNYEEFVSYNIKMLKNKNYASITNRQTIKLLQ